MSHRLQVELEGHELRYSLRINGMVAFEVHDPWGRALQASIAPWLLEGANRIDVALARLPRREDAEEPEFRIALHAIVGDLSPWTRSLVAEYRYSDNESGLYGEALSPVFSHTFHVAAPAPWSFLKSQPYRREDLPLVEDVIRRVHTAVERKNAGALSELFREKHTEVALGLEKPRDEVEAAFFEVLGDLWSEDDFAVDRLRALAIETSAGGRLVHAGAMGGEPSIVCRGGKRAIGISPTLSRIENHYRIVR
jgi:hypothetical protein